MKRSLNLLHDLFNSELTIRIIDTFIMNIYSSGKQCEYYSVSFEDLLEEINRNDNYYRKISASELVPTFFSNKDNLWGEGKFEKTDNLKEIQQSVVDYLGKLNKVVLKNDENSFFKKEELYDNLLFHMKEMYHYFNNDDKQVEFKFEIGNIEFSENK